MDSQGSEPSMFTFLALVQKRPGMYLGMADENARQRLDALDHLIAGYCAALYTHDACRNLAGA